MCLCTSEVMYIVEWKEPNIWNNRLHPCLATSKLEAVWRHNKCKPIIPASKRRTMHRHSRSRDKLRLGIVGSNEESAKGYNSPWLTWHCLNRLCHGLLAAKNRERNCATSMATQHAVYGHRKYSSYAMMFSLSLLSHHCTLDDLLKFNDIERFDYRMLIMTSIMLL